MYIRLLCRPYIFSIFKVVLERGREGRRDGWWKGSGWFWQNERVMFFLKFTD